MAIEDAPIKAVMPVIFDDPDQDLISRAVEILMNTVPPSTFVVTPGEHGRRVMLSRHSYRNLQNALKLEREDVST